MAYRPRRSSKRWLEGAPEYVLAVYDNPAYVDRYMVMFGGSLWDPSMGRTVFELSMSDAPTHPQGVSMWGEMPASVRIGKHIRWLDLPENIRNHVVARATKE